MRISTAGMHNFALAGMSERSNALIKTQSQIATGKRIETPADDPSGAVRALELDRGLAESQQFARNSDIVTNRLSLEEQTLADATDLLQRVRELTVQANNATIDADARQAIAAELQVRFNELVDMSNRRDSGGEYLFAGYSSQTQPFVQAGTTVTYAGDQGVRTLQTSQTQRIADGHSGFEVFENVDDAANPGGTQTLFVTVGNVLSALTRPIVTDADRQQLATDLGAAIGQLDSGLDHLSNVRAEVGARLTTVENTQSTREDRDIEMQKELSNLRDLDYAKAITQLNLQQMGLQAAQASYSRIAQLSLFDYLR